jgi:TRAP-type C4-dicarboxylate transport system substrate-binding protein
LLAPHFLADDRCHTVDRPFICLALLLTLANPVRAEGPITLRMAAIAPEGTAWARELRALVRDIEAQTNHEVTMKWYLGGIAGDELTALDRIGKGQLDGMAGASFCQRLGPSLGITQVHGLFRDEDEARVVLNRLRPIVEKEFEQNGFVLFGIASFGFQTIFSRTPVRSLADLRKGRYWTWNLDRFSMQQLPAMGLNVAPLPIEAAAEAWDEGRVDGFVVAPSVALAYQLSSRAHFLSTVKTGILPGCIMVSQRAFDQLTVENRQIVRAAAAKFAVRFTDLEQVQDKALLSGLFEHQGVKSVPAPASFVSEFFDTAARARQKISEDLVPPALLDQIMGWLDEYRSGHPSP